MAGAQLAIYYNIIIHHAWTKTAYSKFTFWYVFCVLKVFAESLLCSGQEANICLASQLLTLSGGSHRRPPPTQRLPVSSFNYRLSYEVSCELVLNAAKEYFNSAASLMDEDMDLARFVCIHACIHGCMFRYHLACQTVHCPENLRRASAQNYAHHAPNIIHGS